MDAFERMKAKVESLEAKAEVAGELAASVTGLYMYIYISPQKKCFIKIIEYFMNYF